MPRYDYDCAACGARFEVVHGVHADPPSTCPSCGGGPIKKAFAPPTIHFKGSGWAKKERRATTASGRPPSSPEGATPAATGAGGGETGGGEGPSVAAKSADPTPSAASTSAGDGD